MIALRLEIYGVFFRFFLLFNFVPPAVTACNVGVFKPTVHDLSLQQATEIRNFSNMILTLRKFDFKKDKLEQEYHD